MTAPQGSPTETIHFRLNGRDVSFSAHPLASALDFLRYVVKSTGTKEGCKEGECGACAILLDGEVVNACIVPAIHLRGKDVITVEGLGREQELNALQQAFLDHGGTQCGICTPGMLMTGTALLQEGKPLTEERIREYMAGNLCRCTGYGKIVQSLLESRKGES